MLRSGNAILRIPQLRLLSYTAITQYAALDKVIRAKKSGSKKGGKPPKGPGSHMTFKDMTTKLQLNKDAKELQLDFLKPEALETNKLYLYPNVKELHHLGSFNKFQYNELWKSPISISRESTTIPIRDFLQKSRDSMSSKNRMILLGEAGVGKTTLIAQFQSLAKSEQDAIILHFNDCEQLINGTNDYILDPESNLYHQPMFLNNLFNKFKNGNLKQFTQLQLTKQYKIFQYSLSTKNNIVDLINIGKRLKSSQKFTIWQILVNELKLQKKFPVYLTIDNFSEIVKRPFTKYRDTSNQLIYFDQFTFGKFLIDHITGVDSFPNGGGVIVGTSGGRQKSTLNVAIGLEEFDPFYKKNQFDPKLATLLSQNNGLQKLTVPKFNKNELRILVEQCLDSQILRNEQLENVEKTLNGKYILSGNGNPREFYKACVLNYH